MSLQLQPDQLLAALTNLHHPRQPEFEQRLIDLCTLMAAEIVSAIPNLTMDLPSYYDGRVCTPIRALTDGPIPDALQGFDDDGWE